jgi:hypothetical protein
VAKADPAAEPPTCASYNGRFEDPQSLKWVLGLSAVVGMLMSYGRERTCKKPKPNQKNQNQEVSADCARVLTSHVTSNVTKPSR